MPEPHFSHVELVPIFRSVPEFARVSDEGLATLVRASTVRSYKRGEVFLRKAQVPEFFGVVLRGHLRAVHYTLEGRPMTVFVAWPGTACGIMATQARIPTEAEFEVAEPSVVAVVPAAALERLIETEPAAARSLLDECTRQLYEIIRIVKSLTVDVGARVARFIMRRVREAEASGSDTSVVTLAIPRVELAAQLGTVPETLSRAFSALEDEGLIHAEGRAISVLDVQGLAERAQGTLPEGE